MEGAPIMKAQELYDALQKLESKLRDIRYDDWLELKSKLTELQLELEETLDDVRDILRPSIEADIAAALPDNEIDAMAATITATSTTPVDTDSQLMATNLSGDVAITRDPCDVFRVGFYTMRQMADLEDEHKLHILSLVQVESYLLGVEDCKRNGSSNEHFLRDRHYQQGFANQSALTRDS
jgi:hypothetical protein